jgi:ankyrin repeat protein
VAKNTMTETKQSLNAIFVACLAIMFASGCRRECCPPIDMDSPIHKAAEKGDVDVLKILVSQGADVNDNAGFGITPLHAAAGNGKIEAVQFLVSAGADVHAKLDDGRTPLYLAALAGSIEVVEFLVSQGADVHAKTANGGYTLLHASVSGGNVNVVEFFIAQGVDVHAKDNWGNTPLDTAKEYQVDAATIEYLTGLTNEGGEE